MKKLIITSTLLFLFVISLQAQVRIKMKQEGGVYSTPCTVNGLKLRFIFDTGASNVSISLSEAIFMLKNGYLNEADLHGSSYSQLANGEIVKNTTVNIRELEIGGIKLKNIKAIIIHELSAPLLLGQSAIQKLGKIQIEGDQLLIFSFNSPSSTKACKESIELRLQAFDYVLSNDNWDLIAATYQKAYDMCPDSFLCFDIRMLGLAYYRSEEPDLAIKYFEKYIRCFSLENGDIDELRITTLIDLGFLYQGIGNYEEAILNFQKALLDASENEFAEIYINLAFIKFKQSKFQQAIENAAKSEDYILKIKNITINEIKNGKIKNTDLGLVYRFIANCYFELNDKERANEHLIAAALCGDNEAIKSCEMYNLDY